jgi:ankyrin repeat protein
VIAAASNGHLETTRTLLSRKTIITGALVAAARGGYGDVVKLLLDHGADANEVDYGELPAIGYAIINEHDAMFRSLSQTVQAPPHRRSGRLS